MPPRISVCMLARDEAKKIGAALASARACAWCDELIVFDSGSTDATVEIARGIADRVELHEWVDFTTNRRLVVDAARNDWVFILDADEEISGDLAAEVSSLADDAFAAHPVFTMPRRNHLLRRRVRAWEPDRIARLFDRRRVRWPDRAVHDHPVPEAGSIRRLSGPVLHNRGSEDWGDYFDGPRYAARADALAREMLRRGRRVGFAGLLLRPWAAFLKFYLLKGGFLDGSFGLLVAQKAAFSVQLKYARLWSLQQEETEATERPSD